MTDARFEEKLVISTGGFKEWDSDQPHYHRYEPTSYEVLEYLFERYKLKRGDKFVDFGSGKGRVAIYVHHRFKIPVVGIEAQADVHALAMLNRQCYRTRAGKARVRVHFEHGLAEDYLIKPDENRFYFFNSFSVDVFQEVLVNIAASLKEANRDVHLILYYPMPSYTKVMSGHPLFEIHKEIKLPDTSDRKERILIYRSTER